MNKNYTEIAFVLDRSGSMGSCQDAAIEGFNKFLKEQQAEEGLARLTLVLFDTECQRVVESVPVQEVVELNTKTYCPRGSTALLDAIGLTVDGLGARLAQMPEESRPGQVIVAILTDGEENSSQTFSWQDIAARIKHQTEVYRWTFLFLGANQDAIATASKMNISAQNSSQYAGDVFGSISSQRSIGRKIKALRRMARGAATEEEIRDAEASMSNLLDEEDRKERGEPPAQA